MSITILYFAAVREQLGAGESCERSQLPGSTVGDLLQWLRGRSVAHAQALDTTKGVRMACNQVLCGPEAPLPDGAEVAFFPPVTGG